MDVIVDEIKDSLRRVLEHESIHEFAQIWCDIGVEQKIRNDRIEKMVEYVCNLLTEMLEEEKRLKKTLEDSIESCSVELRQLEQLLKLSNQIESFSSNTIIDKERLIRERVDALNKIKHERMKRLKRLMEMETALCHSMGEKLTMSQKWQNTTSIPSEEDLQEYRNVVEQLESIKDQRQVEFRNMREKALLIWEELETTPTDDLGGKLYEGDVTRFTLSVENMTKISKYYTKLEKAASEQEGEAESLREKVISLWDRLEIPSEFREDYISNHQGYKSWVVSELKDELERLNIMKRNNLEKFVEATRVQLHDIWDKCFYGEEQRKEFHPAFTEEIDDDALSAHESELDRMRGFYADNSEIFKLIEKRESLWQRKIDMDMRLNDPGRLNNRGGKLLQEQRLHQKVNKDLPKVEKKLHAILEEWENDHCRHFIIKDQRYIDELDSCWTNYNQTKEEEKVKRVSLLDD
jgi:protein regulator of cytokinesis 1